MTEFDLRAAYAEALKHRLNQGELQQQALRETFERLVEDGVILSSNYSFSSEPTIKLANGVSIRNVPMNLDITYADVIVQWRKFRRSQRMISLKVGADERDADIKRLRGIPIASDENIQKEAKNLEVPEGVLVTRHTPDDIFKRQRFTRKEEDGIFPNIPVHFRRTYGQSLMTWIYYLADGDQSLAEELGIHPITIPALQNGAVTMPANFEQMTVLLQHRFNLPPGAIFTRTYPEDLIADQT